MNNIYVIKYGGSVLVPNETINIDLLLQYRDLIKSHIDKHNSKFIIVSGGGFTAKMYQKAVKAFSSDNYVIDMFGIHLVNVNAKLIAQVFDPNNKNPKTYRDPEELPDKIIFPENNVIVFGAISPGHSTNKDAVDCALWSRSTTIINLSNQDYIYDSDPRTNPEAKPIEKITWDEYLNIIPSEWKPKMSVPFDPVASRLAKQNNLSVYFINGNNPENLKNLIEGNPAKGSVIFPSS